MPLLNQLPRRTYPELSPQLNQFLQQMADAVNTNMGYNGPIQVTSPIDLMGNTIKNVGTPVDESDVVTQAFAQSNYSAEALRPQLEANGSTPLQSVRRINDSTQREATSTWLNQVMSTPPNASTAQVSFSGGGGSTTINVNATTLTRADTTTQPLAGRSDTVANPASFTILTIARAGGVVTATFAATTGITAGQIVGITGVTDSSFDGSFTVTGAVGVTLTWSQSLSNAGSTGGDASLGGVYYYYTKPKSSIMFVSGPFSADTPQNRINASDDAKQIIAVAVVTSGGGQNGQSGGGGTPTTGPVAAGSFF